MAKKILRHALNHKHADHHFELVEGVSMTEPDLSMSVREILQRSVRGQDIPLLSDLEYHGDLDLPDMRTLDLVEKADLVEYAKQQVKIHEEEVKKKVSLRNQARLQSQQQWKKLLAIGNDANKKGNDANKKGNDAKEGGTTD